MLGVRVYVGLGLGCLGLRVEGSQNHPYVFPKESGRVIP